jgi:hypothetical protein
MLVVLGPVLLGMATAVVAALTVPDCRNVRGMPSSCVDSVSLRQSSQIAECR